MMAACTSFSSMAGLPQVIALQVKSVFLNTPRTHTFPNLPGFSGKLPEKLVNKP
ncbi:hypothetical protein NIES2109_13020 [Nostoc sp. HK-01]|nr:hypothetical protein NIES2109_13020 [Nostoc sp. HK-01]